MLLKTLLNKCSKYKSFVFSNVRYKEKDGEQVIEVDVRPRKNAKAICSGCHKSRPTYDTAREPRRFEFVPLWGIFFFFCYQMRRVDCPECGVTVEEVPWGIGKNELTNTYMQYLAHWAKKLSWKEVAESFRTSWEKVYTSVNYVVTWGLERRDLSGVRAIGVDEIQWGKGQDYLTLVYQIDSGSIRLLWVGTGRTVKTFLRFFRYLGEERSRNLQYVCSDMWKPYLKVIERKASQAINILDRFHIVAKLNKAIDEVRADEYRKLLKTGYAFMLKYTRWVLLKRPENLTQKQGIRLRDILRYNLKTIRAYLLKEDFQWFWEYVSPYWAGIFLDQRCTKVMRSKIEPMKAKAVAKTIRNHRELILNWFRAKKLFSSGVVEGLNNKVKLTMRKSYGFRTFKAAELALYHTLGKLSEPQLTHRFY